MILGDRLEQQAGRIGLACAAVAFGLFACNCTRAETLEEAFAEAYQSNPQILGARAGLRATDESVPTARANWGPSVTVSGSRGYASISEPSNPGSSAVVQTLSQSTSSYWTASVSEPIFRGGQTVSQVAGALLAVDAGRAQLAATEGSVLFQVATSYLDCLRDEELLSLTTESEALLRNEFAAVNAQLEASVATRPDKLQVEAQLASAGAARLQAVGALQVSRDGYLRVVGHTPDQLTAPQLRPSLPASRDEAINLAVTTNPTVIAAQALRDAGNKAIDTVTGRLLPEVSLVGSYSRYISPSIGGNNQNNSVTDRSVAVQVTVPLFDGGANYAQVRQAKASFQQLQQAANDARAAAVQQAGQAWDTLQAVRQALPQLTHAVEVAQEAYEGIREQQVLGRKTVTDVLIAEQALIQTRISRTTAKYAASITEFALAQQLGTLSAADLKLDVQLYDPMEHFKQVEHKWFGLGPDVHQGTNETAVSQR